MDNHLHQTLANLAAICEAQFIKRVVFSPGSRSAPLALTFLRNKNFEHYHLVDERSAAYFALGLAKKDLIPTILICTSGTAVLNYAPAIVEAYFQQIPLLVLTADRPPELVDQNDNQAIFQEGVFGKHVLKSFQMPVDYGHTASQVFAQKVMNQAILASVGKRLGPVHVNFPFREPFYPTSDNVTPSENIMVLDYEPSPLQPQFHDEHFLPELINDAKNIWVFGGQSHENFTPHLKHLINDFCQRTGALFFADPLTSLHVNQQVYHYDAWLKTKEVQPPDLVISYGNHFVSKQLKQFMKRNQQVQHVHLQSHEGLADPFFSINYFVETYISSFFEAIQPWIVGKEL
ncbi:MAG: 2-succinyl-5-enolpyruvyl-6-hydroxy-3-cyclohexene-1-carboxylic-acid synthase, partial [Bacteroidetes bacterium]|nr:2-succinyl-5-enolpyruvyl-6-hydroxy-3-cyclohexene-1-carboxylic-acid synthase [Bacteroidota bacterium]